MSKNWYPIIDLDLCTGCLACVSFCTHNVYEVKDGKPYVANPYNCVEFCRGCQKGACSFEAIQYFGEN